MTQNITRSLKQMQKHPDRPSTPTRFSVCKNCGRFGLVNAETRKCVGSRKVTKRHNWFVEEVTEPRDRRCRAIKPIIGVVRLADRTRDTSSELQDGPRTGDEGPGQAGPADGGSELRGVAGGVLAGEEA